MLSADCFVAMGAAAMKTSRIRLGTGVLIPSNRIAAVIANAFASLNKLAPGRIDMGLGTGFTGRRAMGLGAMTLKDFSEYIRVMLALLRDIEPASGECGIRPDVDLGHLDGGQHARDDASGPRRGISPRYGP